MTIHAVLNVILFAMAAVILLPTAAFCIECAAALFPRRRLSSSTCSTLPKTVVVIPAHNEESVIEHTLRALIASNWKLNKNISPFHVLVIADNCDDQTAEVARLIGAEVVERRDPGRRGKGFALNFAVSTLENDPPEVVVVIDADCLTSPQDIKTLARRAWSLNCPVQALNLTDRLPADGPTQAISLLANHFMNQIRPLGLLGLGMPCRLMGTGMAIPWNLLKTVKFSGNLVEDTQLSIDLGLAGHFTMFCPEARVTSAMPVGNRAFVSQRTRWEHGQLHTAASQIPRLIAAAIARRSPRLLAVALDLAIPPLTLLVALLAAGAILSVAGIAAGASWIPAAGLMLGAAAMASSLGLGWLAFCRRQVPLRTFLGVPKYMFRKSPIYARLIFNRQRIWVRTDRNTVALFSKTKEQ